MNYLRTMYYGFFMIVVIPLIAGTAAAVTNGLQSFLPEATQALSYTAIVFVFVFSLYASLDLWRQKRPVKGFLMSLGNMTVTIGGINLLFHPNGNEALVIYVIVALSKLAIILNPPAQKPSESTKESSDA